MEIKVLEHTSTGIPGSHRRLRAARLRHGLGDPRQTGIGPVHMKLCDALEAALGRSENRAAKLALAVVQAMVA